MATQIASTPVVRGKSAVRIYQEANQKRSQAAKKGSEILRKEVLSKLNNES